MMGITMTRIRPFLREVYYGLSQIGSTMSTKGLWNTILTNIWYFYALAYSCCWICEGRTIVCIRGGA
jgi:hypothetical protein